MFFVMNKWILVNWNANILYLTEVIKEYGKQQENFMMPLKKYKQALPDAINSSISILVIGIKKPHLSMR